MAEGHRSEGVCSFRDDQCGICTLGFENERSITVTEKGMSNLISYSEKRGKSDLHTYLTECMSKSPIGTVLIVVEILLTQNVDFAEMQMAPYHQLKN